jgi:hypothetical protein
MLGHSPVLLETHTLSLRTIKVLLLLFKTCYVCTVHPWHFHNIQQGEVQPQALATPCLRKKEAGCYPKPVRIQKNKISYPCQGPNHDSPVSQPTALSLDQL